ncbi:MAG: MBL fold metallo-hydrolase [Eubacterium sp.]|nr:MBL fold metallo-hydrolase [Eubacterium sp.]
MKITHIKHSGFTVELEKTVLIFDWYTGKLPEFRPDQEIYCFVSHSHGDHYGSCIWRLREQYPDVHYILDRNVRVPGAGLKTKARLPRADVLKVRPHKNYEIGSIRIYTLLSTDQGVAFVVAAEDKSIYHAGDLNVWYWEEDSEKENKWQVGMYRKEISRLADYHFDAAFVPMDPRLESHGPDAVAWFLGHVDCRQLIPMHYWSQEADARAYLEEPRLQPYREKIVFLPETTR